MLATCPACDTQYNIADDKIGSAGRKVRCARCGDRWHVTMDAEDHQDADMAEWEADTQEEADAEPVEASQDDIDALFGSDAPKEENSQDDIDALFGSDAPEEENSQDDIDAMFGGGGGEVEASSEGSQDDIDALFAESEADQAQSQDDIDSLFGESSPDEGTELTGSPSVKKEISAVVDEQAWESNAALPVETSRVGSKKTRKKLKANSRRISGSGRWAPAIVSVAAAVLLIVAGIFMRTTFVRYVPDLAGLYEAVGLEVNLRGLAFRDVRAHQKFDQVGSNAILIEGEILNISDRAVRVPLIEFTLLGRQNDRLHAWQMPPKTEILGPGEWFRFESSVMPPSSASDISMRFVDDRRQARLAGRK